MARPLRLQFPGATYHLTSRGNARQSIFLDGFRRILGFWGHTTEWMRVMTADGSHQCGRSALPRHPARQVPLVGAPLSKSTPGAQSRSRPSVRVRAFTRNFWYSVSTVRALWGFDHHCLGSKESYGVG